MTTDIAGYGRLASYPTPPEAREANKDAMLLVSIRPPRATGWPWGILALPASASASNVEVALPYVVTGTVVTTPAAPRSVLQGGVLRVYTQTPSPTRLTEAVYVQVAETTINDDGSFGMLLPSTLPLRSDRLASP